MQFNPTPDFFRLLAGVLCFLTAVLLWSAVGTNEYVINHMLLTFNFNNNLIVSDQFFSVGAFYICTSLSYTYNGVSIGSTSTSCASIGNSCEAYLQLQNIDGTEIFDPPLGLQMKKGCGVFKFGRGCLVVAALGFTFVSLFMIVLPCNFMQRLVARWGQNKVDRVLIAEGVTALIFALISILCQPDNASDEFDDATACQQATSLPSSDGVNILGCQTPTSTWGTSFDCHAVSIVLGALGVAFYIGGWRMFKKQELTAPLVDADRGEVGGMSGGRDSESWAMPIITLTRGKWKERDHSHDITVSITLPYSPSSPRPYNDSHAHSYETFFYTGMLL